MIFPTLARLGFFKTNQPFVIRPFKQATSNFQDLCSKRCRFRNFIFSLQSSEKYSQSLKKPENTKKHAIVKPFNQDGWQFYGHCGLILRSSLCSKLKLMKIVFAVHLPRTLCSKLKLMKIVFAVHLPRALCCFAASMLGSQAIPMALLHSSCPLLAVTWFRLKPFESVWICYRQEMRTLGESSLRYICRVNARQPNPYTVLASCLVLYE